MNGLIEKREALLAWISRLESCAVAFSGGVDSAVVAQAAHLALRDRAIAVTGVSASLASGELELAEQLARQIGIRHEVISTDELAQEAYARNTHDRCFHCKTELYTQVERILPQLGVRVILNGANADDLADYRPGMQAAANFSVRSPLAECGLTKSDVRELAAHWNLPVWDKPATPCLSSRIAYGLEVTPEKLARVDRGELLLRELGLRECRIRYHHGDLARIEVPISAMPRLLDPQVRESLIPNLRGLGFRFIALDLEGFQSGSLNRLLSIGAGNP
jgi:uncharacterized protein